jgi:peptidoglycan/LPS O-acetylase OafA/YrhL
LSKIHFLTGYRGVAAVWIILFHLSTYFESRIPSPIYTIINKGYIAVDLFFILSGYVIGLNYYQAVQERSGIITFFIKRFARIYPLHIFMLFAYVSIPAVYFLTGRIYPDTFVNNISTFLFNIFLIHNWGLSTSLSWNVPSWSISSETAAYLIFPFLINKICRIRDCGLILFAFFLIPAILQFIYIVFGYSNIGEGITHVGTIRCLAEFTMGILLFSLKRLTNSGKLVSYLLLAVGLSMFLIIMITDALPILVPLSFSALLYGTLITNNPIAKTFSLRPFVLLGDISYSMYLVHYFVREWMKILFLNNSNYAPLWWILLYLIVVLGVSYILYRFLEIPARKLLSKTLLPRYELSTGQRI